MKTIDRTSAEIQNETRENAMTMHNHNIVGAQLAARILDVGSASADLGAGGLKSALQRGIGIALAALFLAAPNAALADNECGLQVGTTPVDCGDSSYGSGVTYDAVGDLFIDFTNSFRSTIGTSAGGDGIDLNATGSDSIFFDSATTNTEIQSNGTTGALLSVTTANGNIDIDTAQMDADESAAGVTHAIFAESTGSGNIDITATGSVDAASPQNPDDSIGIEAITGSGDLTITASGTVSGNGAGIAATAGSGLLTINLDSGGSVVVDTGVDDMDASMDLTSANQTVLNNSGAVGTDDLGAAAMSLRVSGGSLVLNNNDGGVIHTVIDLSGLNDGYVFNNNAGATWRVNRIRNNEVDQGGQTSHLGAGTLNNAGTIGLEAGDLIMAPGTDYAGGDGVLEFEVIPGKTGQTSCTSPTVSGCLHLSGGSTAGTTLVRPVFLPAPGQESAAAANTGIVLVDVGGGSSSAGHFMLDPSVEDYKTDPVYGSVIDLGGVLDHTLLYNPNTQQHLLATVPQREGVEYVSFIHEALSIWHTTSDAVAGRQADLQSSGQRGGWVRIVSEQTERDSTPTMTTHGNSFTYDNDYKLNTKSLIAGYDLTAADNHVIGAHMGIVAARQDYRSGSSSRDETRGATFGAYAGWWNDAGLTLDGTLNANMLTIDHKPGRDLETNESNIRSFGLRAETGWRVPLSETFYVQPLATAAYVHANIENLELRDNEASFENTDSQRAALGLRLGGERELSGDRYSHVKYWLTARAWEEFAGDDAHVAFKVQGGDDLVIKDDIGGSFEEVGLGVSLTGPDESLEVFLSGNIRSGDQTDGNNVTVGARLNW